MFKRAFTTYHYSQPPLLVLSSNQGNQNQQKQVPKGKITAEEYETFINSEIEKVIRFQEEIDLDVLVHGEPERK